MRYIKTIAILLAVILQGCSTYRQNMQVTATSPEAVKFLPAYPSFEDREAFFNDSLLFRRGLALRDTERGEQAVIDAGITLDFYLERFGEVMGVKLSEQDSPAVAAYLKAAYEFTGKGIGKAKHDFTRQRPYSYFGVHSSIPEEEERCGQFSSFPSGHALMAWVMALALVSIDEEHQYEILRLGYELGQSRVISGFHYQSDVDAGRHAAAAAYARIVSDPGFVRLMELAAKEVAGF